jgi:hypothetical protein
MPRITPANLLRAYREIGYGNATFVSTEIEYADGAEVRRQGCVPFYNITEIYLRVWIGKTVYALSSRHGWNIRTRPRKALKILFGIGGWVDETVWTQGATRHA